MEKTVIAVIGCGRISRHAHCPAFSKIENVLESAKLLDRLYASAESRQEVKC